MSRVAGGQVGQRGILRLSGVFFAFMGKPWAALRIDLLDGHIAGDLGMLFLSGGTEYDFE